MPAAAMMLSVYHRFGVPRYVSWFLGSQDGALPVVHIARVGSDLVIPALLGLSASVPVILLVHLPPSTATVIAAVIAIVIVAGALTFGVASYRHAVEMVDREQPLRIAAVSVSPSKFDLTVPGYRDVEGTILRYEPHIRAAAADGARLIVLPEYAVVVSPENRDRWLAAISQWAKETNAKIVAGVIEQNRQKNQLVIADENGRIAAIYDKQHPAPGLEPKPERRTPPALLPDPVIPLSAVQCVDLDYPDLTRPVSRAGGVLAVPADDWTEIFDMHHRSAVWAAVTAGVPVVRSNGHGISAVYDAAGRVVAQSSSLDGPVVLVTNVRAARQPQSTNVAVSQAA
jgi:predicted amidohydrolase